MYSPYYKKLVFIDYNLSEIINVTLGEKIVMNLKGTIDYCYSDMVKMFNKKLSAALIDPYYCDLYALNKTIVKFEEISIYQVVDEDSFFL